MTTNHGVPTKEWQQDYFQKQSNGLWDRINGSGVIRWPQTHPQQQPKPQPAQNSGQKGSGQR